MLLQDRIYLLLGSNQGDPGRNLAAARNAVTQRVGALISQSSLYRSAAWGLENQPDFWNQVLQLSSPLPPSDLLQTILDVEQKLGRVRTERWGPRIIDIDLLFYEDRIINTDSLILPHPGIPYRRFTLVPLAEIAADFIHPVLKKSVLQLLEECQDKLEVEKIPPPNSDLTRQLG